MNIHEWYLRDELAEETKGKLPILFPLSLILKKMIVYVSASRYKCNEFTDINPNWKNRTCGVFTLNVFFMSILAMVNIFHVWAIIYNVAFICWASHTRNFENDWIVVYAWRGKPMYHRKYPWVFFKVRILHPSS